MFFNETLRENLAFNNHLSETSMYEALEKAQLSKFVKSLPNKLDTIIGEGGVKLSGGQKQRLSISRALLRNPKLLILDEATSSLDSNSEKEFQASLDNIASQYTLVVVAHRLSTIKKANNIIVLNEGKIIQSGNFDELSGEDGLFANMVKAQFI